METKQSFRTKASEVLTSPAFVLTCVLLISISTVIYGGVMMLAGLLICLITFWATKWDWSFFGISKPNWGPTLVKATVITLVLFGATEILEAVLEIVLNEPVDLSNFDAVEGNMTNFLVLLGIGWTLAAVGEEVFYRGYIMKRIAALFGDGNIAWLIGAVVSSLLFGIAHNYQGISGMISTGFFGFVCGIVFLKNPKNLILCMLIHGLTDTLGIYCLYKGWDPITADMLSNLF